MSETRPNILFVTADQWRGGCLSALGHPHAHTPNLDALASRSTVFLNHFANCAPCGPSRATLHTGLYQMNHRVVANGTPLDRRLPNWATLLRNRGYTPTLIGYTDQTPDPEGLRPDDPALRSYEGVLPGLTVELQTHDTPVAWADWLRDQGYPVPDDPMKLYWERDQEQNYEHGADRVAALRLPAELHDTQFVTDRAIAWIEQQRPGWCLHLSLLRPHPPWIAPEPWAHLVHPSEVEPPRRLTSWQSEAQLHPWLDWHLRHNTIPAPQDELRLARWKGTWFGLMAEVDHHIGRLLAALQRNGFAGDTLVIFTSDHGEQMGDHWLIGKSGYFDESYHVPMIVHLPGGGARREQRFSEHVDVAPTILDFAGIDSPTPMDGRSLLPLVRGESVEQWRSAAHWEFDYRDVRRGAGSKLGIPARQCQLTVRRTHERKLVRFPHMDDLLLDLAADPDERTAAPRSELTNQLLQLLEWREQFSHEGYADQVATETGLQHGWA